MGKHTIEENLERIADALEALASAPAPAAEGSAPPVKATRRTKDKTPAPAPAPAAPEAAPAPAAPAAPAAPEAPPAPPAAPAAPAAEAVTRDQVREALRQFRTAHSKEDAIAILRKHGANSVSDAPEAALGAILADFSK